MNNGADAQSQQARFLKNGLPLDDIKEIKNKLQTQTKGGNDTFPQHNTAGHMVFFSKCLSEALGEIFQQTSAHCNV